MFGFPRLHMGMFMRPELQKSRLGLGLRGVRVEMSRVTQK